MRFFWLGGRKLKEQKFKGTEIRGRRKLKRIRYLTFSRKSTSKFLSILSVFSIFDILIVKVQP